MSEMTAQGIAEKYLGKVRAPRLQKDIEAAILAAEQQMQERCAKVAQDFARRQSSGVIYSACNGVAAAIRALDGETHG